MLQVNCIASLLYSTTTISSSLLNSLVPLVFLRFCCHHSDEHSLLWLHKEQSWWLYSCGYPSHRRKLGGCLLDGFSRSLMVETTTWNGYFMVADVCVFDTEQLSGWCNTINHSTEMTQERFWSEARIAKWLQDTDRKSINTDGHDLWREACRKFHANASHSVLFCWSWICGS